MLKKKKKEGDGVRLIMNDMLDFMFMFFDG